MNNSTSWMDVSVSYALTEQLTLRADVANLQDKIDTRYLGSAEYSVGRHLWPPFYGRGLRQLLTTGRELLGVRSCC